MKSKTPPRAAGAVIFRRAPEGIRLLILRAYRNWDFPKGLVEPDEDELEAAKREVAEETGLENLVFPFGETSLETAPYSGGKVVRYYIAETNAAKIELPVSEELGRPEHNEWRWVDFDTAAGLLPPRLQPVLRWASSVLYAYSRRAAGSV